MKNSGFISILLLFILLLAIFFAGAYITLNVRDTNVRNVFSSEAYHFTLTYSKDWKASDNLETEGRASFTATTSLVYASVKSTRDLSSCIGTERVLGKNSFVCKRDRANAYYLPLKNEHAGKMIFIESGMDSTDPHEIETIGRSLTYLP